MVFIWLFLNKCVLQFSQTPPSTPSLYPKTKKGVKRKADTTTPVITTVAGKIPTAGSPEHDISLNDEDSLVGVEDVDNASRLPGRLQAVNRRESSGRTIRPPKSRDLDSEESVSIFVVICGNTCLKT